MLRMSNVSDRATTARRPQTRERPQPQFIARAKVQNGWVSIGAAWPLRSGDEGFSLKLTTIPLNWDGRFILLPPLPNGDDPTPQDE
jgi:hypothetical protein